MASTKNLNVLVEKPLTLDFKQSQKLNTIFKKKKLKLFVVKQNRFNKTLIILKEIIEKKLLGKIYLVNLNVFWHRPQKYYDQDKWKGSKILDGGAIYNQASHHIDILNWLFGKNKYVSCITSTIARNIQTEDTALINLRNKNKTLISANITVLSYKKNYECILNIISEKGNIKIGGPALNKFEHIDAKNIGNIKKIFNKYNYKLNKVLSYGHEDVYKSLANDLIKGTKTCPDSNDTMESIRLIENCHKSSKNKKHLFIN
jgi:UDP-N-acetyl-2-amino-2-deoxyglucuronate dehydrogenase